jgi:hypothetical protein
LFFDLLFIAASGFTNITVIAGLVLSHTVLVSLVSYSIKVIKS